MRYSRLINKLGVTVTLQDGGVGYRYNVDRLFTRSNLHSQSCPAVRIEPISVWVAITMGASRLPEM